MNYTLTKTLAVGGIAGGSNYLLHGSAKNSAIDAGLLSAITFAYSFFDGAIVFPFAGVLIVSILFVLIKYFMGEKDHIMYNLLLGAGSYSAGDFIAYQCNRSGAKIASINVEPIQQSSESASEPEQLQNQELVDSSGTWLTNFLVTGSTGIITGARYLYGRSVSKIYSQAVYPFLL